MINFSSMLDGKDEGHLQEKGVNEVSVFILRAEKTDISQQNKHLANDGLPRLLPKKS